MLLFCKFFNFIPALRKQLCPSLVAIMGNPVNDKTITSHHGFMGAAERERLSERLSPGNWMQEVSRCEMGRLDIFHIPACPPRQDSARRWIPPVDAYLTRAGALAAPPAPRPGLHP